mmetsp:Transcript_69/g.229  ORF Transcript_69/g.229 Transcript_69/m.229 type:complete len:606 (-) Transcript_69:101-1918(-)
MRGVVGALALLALAVPSAPFHLGRPAAPLRLRLHAVSGADPSPKAQPKPKPNPGPAVGDVVEFPGKWKGEMRIGQIRNLQYIGSRSQWIADIAVLDDIGEDIYRAKGKIATEVEDVTTLRPLRALYVRSSDGFKVMKKSETAADGSVERVPLRRADAYELDGFELPKPKVDEEVLQRDLDAYEALKKRLVVDAAGIGAAGAVIAGVGFGVDRGVIFGAGAVAGLAYLGLLGRATDTLGRRSKFDDALALSRFFVPVGLVAGLAAKRVVLDGAPLVQSNGELPLGLVPMDQFAAAMIGFLVYRIPLLIRELGPATQGIDIGGMRPGNLGKGADEIQSTITAGARVGGKGATGDSDAPGQTVTLNEVVSAAPKAEDGLGPTANANERLTVMLMAGPAGSGIFDVADWVERKNPEKVAVPKWVEAAELGAERFAAAEENGRFFLVRGEGETRRGLRLEDLLAAGRVPLTPEESAKRTAEDRRNAPLPLLAVTPREAQAFVAAVPPAVDLVGAWVSLDSMDKFESNLRADPAYAKPEAAEETQTESGLVLGVPADPVELQMSAVISDIEWALKSRLFDFTILNDDVRSSGDEMRRAIEITKQTRDEAIE